MPNLNSFSRLRVDYPTFSISPARDSSRINGILAVSYVADHIALLRYVRSGNCLNTEDLKEIDASLRDKIVQIVNRRIFWYKT